MVLLLAGRVFAAEGFENDATVKFDDVKEKWQLEVEAPVSNSKSTLWFSIYSVGVVGTLEKDQKVWSWSIHLHCAVTYPKISEIIVTGWTNKPTAQSMEERSIDGIPYSTQTFPIATELVPQCLNEGLKARIYDTRGDADIEIDNVQFAAAADLARKISAGRVPKVREQKVHVGRSR